jgi:hypothetical protein
VAKEFSAITALLTYASRADTSSKTGIKFHVMAARNPELITWAMSKGFRIVEQSNLMVLGDTYTLPSSGLYLPSVSY